MLHDLEAPGPTSHATCPANPDAPIEASPITLRGMTSHATESPWNPPRPDDGFPDGEDIDYADPLEDGPVEWVRETRRFTGDEARRVTAMIGALRARLAEHAAPRNTAYRAAGRA
jgi:hypothetical protein